VTFLRPVIVIVFRNQKTVVVELGLKSGPATTLKLKLSSITLKLTKLLRVDELY